MAEKVKATDKKLKAFIKKGGRPNAEADFNKILKKITKKLDK